MRALARRSKLLIASVFLVIAAVFGVSASPAAAAPYSSDISFWVGVDTNVPLPGQNILVYVHDAATNQTLVAYLNINGSSVFLGYLYANAQGIAYGYLKLPEGVAGSGSIAVSQTAPAASSPAVSATPTPTPQPGATPAPATPAPAAKAAVVKTVSVPVDVGGSSTSLTSYTKVAATPVPSSGVDAISVTPAPAATPVPDFSALSYNSPSQQNATDAGFKSGYADAMVAVVAIIALLLLGAGGAAQLYVARRR